MLKTFNVVRRQRERERYWVLAKDHFDARQIVALNVPGAEDAESGAVFVCLVDPSRNPTLGFILDRDGKQIPIERLADQS